MADIVLKPALTKVLHAQGKRKFHFAYGTGKRTDGKGDGHLVVGPKKPKKDDLQSVCPCQQYVEGFCWSSPAGDSIFFQAKKGTVSQVLVAKMALTAKKISGLQYDFQLPTPEEESRAEKLGLGEGEGQEDGAKGGPPKVEGETPVPPPEGEAPPPPPPPPPPGVKSEAPPPPTSQTNEEATNFTSRLKALLAEAAKHPAAAQAKLLASEAQLLSRKGDFGGAHGVLDKLEILIGKAAPKEEAPGKGGPSLQEVKEKVKALTARVDALEESHPDLVPELKAELKSLLVDAAKNVAVADRLSAVEGRIASAERAKQAVGEIDLASPARRASFVKARDLWNVARTAARTRMQKFAQTVANDPDAKQQPDYAEIKAAAANLVKHLDFFDDSLAEALTRAATDEIEVQRGGIADALDLIKEYQNELQTNDLFELTDANDVYTNFQVGDALGKALQLVADRLKK